MVVQREVVLSVVVIVKVILGVSKFGERGGVGRRSVSRIVLVVRRRWWFVDPSFELMNLSSALSIDLSLLCCRKCVFRPVSKVIHSI